MAMAEEVVVGVKVPASVVMSRWLGIGGSVRG